jgi:hypothetical protein
MPIFNFWQGLCQTFFGSQSAKLFFWQPKPLLAVGTRELVAFILGSIFLAVKSVFGRILPKIKVGTISAKNKSWQSYCFWHVQIVTHFVRTHTPHTQQKNTPKAPRTHPHTPNTLLTHSRTTPCGAGGARTSVNVNMLPSPLPDWRRRPEK